MANFTRVRAAGLWLPNSTILQAELEALDDRYTAINGEGGTYALSDPLTLGGAPLVIDNGSIDIVDSTLTLDASADAALQGAVIADDIEMSSSNRVKLESRSLTRTEAHEAISNTDATNWIYGPTSTRWQQVLLSSASRLVQPLRFPDGCTVTALAITLQAASTHTVLPTNMPLFSFARIEVATSTLTGIGSPTVDPSADVATYEAVHVVTMTGLSEVVDNSTYRYLISIVGEHGGDEVAGLRYFGTRKTFTTTSMDDGASS